LTSPSPQSSPRTDYFSFLPNELLHVIFEYAYKDLAPTAPLSKRLLPFFEKYLYRKISLPTVSAVDRFITLIDRIQHKGSLVYNVALPKAPEDLRADFEAQLPHFLSLLPNLVSLDVPYSPRLFIASHTSAPFPPYLLCLKSFATSPNLYTDAKIDLDKLAQLASLPCLDHLKLYDWHEHGEENIHRSRTTVLPGIKTLEIDGEAADIQTPVKLIEACPSLLHLDLESTYMEGDHEFARYLHLLPSNLRSLSLHGIRPAAATVDTLLPRFNQLNSLHLGDGCFEYTVHSVLQQLPLLGHLHLGKGVIDPAGFVSLIIGSSRLPSLRTIILDFDTGTVGRIIKRPSRARFNIESEMEKCDVNMSDWFLPGEVDSHRFNPVGLQQLIEVARENEVVIRGRVFVGLENAVAYRIEENNRAIIDALGHQRSEHLQEVRNVAARNGVPLPPLDLDSLDLDRLELVELELPEQDWFVLSLRNKE